MKTRTINLLPLFAALLLISACAAGKPVPRHAPIPAESPNGVYLARTAAAELHIVSPGGRISIGNLEIDNGKPPLVAQADSPALAQCPFPAEPATSSSAGDREAGPDPTAGSGGDVGNKAVEQAGRTDAAAAGEYREPEKTNRTLKVPKRTGNPSSCLLSCFAPALHQRHLHCGFLMQRLPTGRAAGTVRWTEGLLRLRSPWH